jgi:hypothetical protein
VIKSLWLSNPAVFIYYGVIVFMFLYETGLMSFISLFYGFTTTLFFALQLVLGIGVGNTIGKLGVGNKEQISGNIPL